MFITASKDNYSKLFDTESMQTLKEFKTERPVNSASVSPIRDQVVLGGGQEAMEVTTTSSRVGKFDARFFHDLRRRNWSCERTFWSDQQLGISSRWEELQQRW